MKNQSYSHSLDNLSADVDSTFPQSLEAVFLDRDGVINRERADYVKNWQELEILPGALNALRQLALRQLPIAVLTNQSAIGRGLVTEADVRQIHRQLALEVQQAGGRIDAFFLCPHHPNIGCDCRKPKPGLLQQAAQHFSVNLQRCVFIGDSITDFQAARAAGCQSILVKTGLKAAQLETLLQTEAFDGNKSPESKQTQEQAEKQTKNRLPLIVADLEAAVALLFDSGSP